MIHKRKSLYGQRYYNFFKQTNEGELFQFSAVSGKKISASFSSSDLSSCGGLMLVREAEKECDIIDRISSCIKDDSIIKMCAGRLPSDATLASQPSMSRLENKVSMKKTYIKLEFASKHPMRAEMETAFRYRLPA